MLATLEGSGKMLRFRAAVVITVTVLVALATASTAYGQTPTLDQLALTVADMQKTIAAQQVTIDDQQQRIAQLQTTLASPVSTPIIGQDAQGSVLALKIEMLKNRLDSAQSVLDLAPYLEVSQAAKNGVGGPNIMFHGVNIHIQNGGKRGSGNLILGYDAPLDTWSATEAVAKRTGSHTLVIGDGNSWSGPGGIVSGWANSIGSAGGSVLGGDNNAVNSPLGVIVGGARNHIDSTGQDNVIGGGYGNNIVDSIAFSCVIGGQSNTVAGAGVDNMISGGGQNQIRMSPGGGGVGTISGGYGNLIDSEDVDVAAASKGGDGGFANTCSSISGGRSNKITAGFANAISGGDENLASADVAGTVSGGRNNSVVSNYMRAAKTRYKGNFAAISGGLNHILSGEDMWFAGDLPPTK